MNKNVFEQLNIYYEKMLQQQFKVSECIEHKLTKGEIREDFIKKLIKEKINNIKTLKGVIVDNKDYQSEQIDLIIPKSNAINSGIGEHNIVEVKDVKFAFEIKSYLKAEHIKKFDSTLKSLKEKNNNIYGGIICYKLDCSEKNLLKNFGYNFDNQLENYNPSEEKYINNYNNIDCIVSFDKEKEFFLSKDIQGEYFLERKVPIINKLFMILNNEEIQ